MAGLRPKEEEDRTYESTLIGKKDLHKVHGNPSQGCCARYLREFAPQAATGITIALASIGGFIVSLRLFF
jgi:hypothetical protein